MSCNISDMRALQRDFQDFKETATISIAAVSGVVLALAIALIVKIVCDCRARKASDDSVSLVNVRDSRHIPQRKFSEAFLDNRSEFSVASKRSKSDDGIYDNFTVTMNDYHRPSFATHSNGVAEEGEEEIYEDLDRERCKLQVSKLNKNAVIRVTEPEDMPAINDIEEDLYDELDTEDIKNYIASRIYEELPNQQIGDLDMPIAIDKRSFIKSAMYDTVQSPPAAVAEASPPKRTAKVTIEQPPVAHSPESYVNYRPQLPPKNKKGGVVEAKASEKNEKKLPTKAIESNPSAYIERDDEDMLYMSLNEIKQRGFVQRNKLALQEKLTKGISGEKPQRGRAGRP